MLKTTYNDKGEELTEMVWEDDPNWKPPSQPSSAAPQGSAPEAPELPAAPAKASAAAEAAPAGKKQAAPASGEQDTVSADELAYVAWTVDLAQQSGC